MKSKKNVILEEYDNFNNRIENQIKSSNLKDYKNLFRNKDKKDRATIELCLDPKTLHRLDKLIVKGDLERYEGCLSTGKEANVYYGKGFEGRHLAIKIYKTSILVFKDRERYITGEFRFRHGYCKSNPRKMVSIWAEKEVRNLKRIQLSGINAPSPLLLKSNLIIMELIGNGNQPAPRLKDAEVENYDSTYSEVIQIMYIMFQKCKLVHSDLSEYNLLYLNKTIYVIDVAQAVEDDHPNALTFLKRDCTNINNFFNKCGVDVITNRQLFNFISSLSTNKELSLEDTREFIKMSREMNRNLGTINSLYFEQENVKFENSDFFRTLTDVDEIKIGQNSEVRNVLTQLCGIVDRKDSPYYKEEIDNFTEHSIVKLSNDYCEDESLRYSTLDEKEVGVENYGKEDDKDDKDDSDEEDSEDESDQEESEDGIDTKNSELNEIVNEKLNLYFDISGKIIDKETYLKNKLEKNSNIKVKKPHNWDPFEGLSKAERKKRVKEDNKIKREGKILSKYEKKRKIEKTSGKKK